MHPDAGKCKDILPPCCAPAWGRSGSQSGIHAHEPDPSRSDSPKPSSGLRRSCSRRAAGTPRSQMLTSRGDARGIPSAENSPSHPAAPPPGRDGTTGESELLPGPVTPVLTPRSRLAGPLRTELLQLCRCVLLREDADVDFHAALRVAPMHYSSSGVFDARRLDEAELVAQMCHGDFHHRLFVGCLQIHRVPS